MASVPSHSTRYEADRVILVQVSVEYFGLPSSLLSHQCSILIFMHIRIYAILTRRSNCEFSEPPTKITFSEIGDHRVEKSTSIFGGFEMSANAKLCIIMLTFARNRCLSSQLRPNILIGKIFWGDLKNIYRNTKKNYLL